MTFDNLDIFIVKEIWEECETTTWEIAKRYFNFNNLNSREDKRLMNRNHQLIKDRLKKLSKLSLIKITKCEPNSLISKNIYTLAMKNIKVGKHKFPDKYSKAMCLRINGKWEVFEL